MGTSRGSLRDGGGSSSEEAGKAAAGASVDAPAAAGCVLEAAATARQAQSPSIYRAAMLSVVADSCTW